MKRILVTGGAGFIGSHLCKKLLEKSDDEVICLDNLFTGKLENIQSLLDLYPSRINFLNQDITEPLNLPLVRLDQIYNLACPASPIHYQKDPVKTILTNVVGIKNVLDAARKFKSRVLQASTSEVYGDPQITPQREDYWGNVNPIGDRSCYDEGKRAAEALLVDFHKQYKEEGLEIRIARIFNTYGPNMAMEDGRVVSNFIIQALQNKPITIYGKGQQTRSFCYVSDTVDGLHRLMNYPDKKFTGPINIGNPREQTIKEIAQTIKELTCSNSSFVVEPLPKDDPQRRQPDITLAKSYLGWEPKVALEEGLPKTISYFRGIISKKVI